MCNNHIPINGMKQCCFFLMCNFIYVVLCSLSEPLDLPIAKAKDLQSSSTLEQFMAKLCHHHQRQMVNAIGFLQTEVKALTSSNTQKAPKSTSGIQVTACSTAKSGAVTAEKSCPELKFPGILTPKLEVQEMSHSIPSSCAMKNVPENAVSLKTSASPALDLRSPGSGGNRAPVTPTANPMEAENNRNGDHAPLKMKIMTSNVAAGKKLSCVLDTSLSSHSDTLEDRQGNSKTSNRTETHSARLSSSVKRHNQTSHAHQARQRETLGHAKDKPGNLFSVHMTIPSDSPRTARKTIKSSSDHRIRDSACRGIADPDLGHCDIVFIDKPITECFKEQRRGMFPRRNARKSTRGHLYSDEIWELKTVRTLAGRGKCPNPMPELITLVTPKQVLSKPEGVPPVNMPFAGACREAMNQHMSTEESDESVSLATRDTVEVAASEEEIPVETTPTDQCQGKGKSPPSSPIRPPTENKETDVNTDVEQNTTGDSGTTAKSEESVAEAPFEAEKENTPELQEDIGESKDQIVTETVVEPSENVSTEENEPQMSSVHNSEPVLQQNRAPSPVAQVEEEKEQNSREEIQDEQPQELQTDSKMQYDNVEVTVKSDATVSAEEPMEKETEMKTSEAVDGVLPLESEGDNDIDVSSKTLDALLKELPPWRRKKGTVVSPPKRLRKTEGVVVGFVNGRPISASDRSLRRRSNNSTTSPNKTPMKSSRNVPNKTSVDSTIDSTVENKSLEKPLPETDRAVKSIETTPGVQQVKESPSDTPSSPKSKSKQKKVKRDQDSLPVLSDQRQLRSASQRPAGTPLSSPKSNAVTSILSPKPIATPALPLPSSLPVASPSIGSSSPTASETSHQQAVPETTVVLNVENIQQVEETIEELQKNKVENIVQAKLKLGSTKAVGDDSQSEQLNCELSSPLENQSPEKTEMQNKTMPLRSKRALRKEAEAIDAAPLQKQSVASLEGRSASGDESSSSPSEKPKRMPLRSESSKVEMSHQSVTQSSPVDNKKLALRSQRLAVASTSAPTVDERQSDVTSPVRIISERIIKAPVKPLPVSVASTLPQSSAVPAITPRSERTKQANKFFQNLTGEENQHLITNLNIKYDKMQKGWVPMDKEGHPVTKYRNKSDRQAAIWKSKRRARKSKSSEHQKYSPVQMLFMKGFNLTSICRWFLDTTETKSLVIVKKVNTRLPSETQLFFHSSSSASGTSQGVFPSQQAERLKKHLKKFAIASPVKSNPKNQRLIAKALEQEANSVQGKERGESPSTTPTKSHSSAKASGEVAESQKSSGKSKNPASARILRKYSNIREKMQVQQTNVRLKKASKTLKKNNMRRLATKKSSAKSNLKPSLRAKKSPLPVGKQMKASAARMERRRTLAGKKAPKHPAQQRPDKAPGSGRASRDATKNDELPKRCSQRLGSPKQPEHNPVDASKSKVDNKKLIEAEKIEVEKPALNKAVAAKIQTKESSQSSVSDIKGTERTADAPPQGVEVKSPPSPDQVLTRSQRKIEAAVSLRGSSASKRPTKSSKTQSASPKAARRSEEAALPRRAAVRPSAKRKRTASLPRRKTTSATKRARAFSQTPAKRTRTSLSK